MDTNDGISLCDLFICRLIILKRVCLHDMMTLETTYILVVMCSMLSGDRRSDLQRKQKQWVLSLCVSFYCRTKNIQTRIHT